MKNIAIILAGWKWERFWNKLPKQFVKLAWKPVIQYTIEKFNNHSLIDEILVVINKDYITILENIIKQIKLNKTINIIIWWATRQESSYNALKFLEDKVKKEDNVLFHDAVRPFIDPDIITNVVESLKRYNAVDVAIPVVDTLIKVKDNFIVDIPKRNKFMRWQTPQGFKYWIIKESHERAKKDNFSEVTDDCWLVLKYFPEEKIYVVRWEEKNIKITYPIDIFIANYLIQLWNKIKNTSVNENYFNWKVVVIFWYSSGIWKEIFSLLKSIENCKVYWFSRSNGVDVRNVKDVQYSLQQVYEKEKRIDIIINTAWVLYKWQLEDLSYHQILEQIEVNYIWSVIVSKESIKYLKQTKWHLILFWSSSYSRWRENYTIYSSTKAALVNFVQWLAEELGKYDIKVNIISPERTLTPMRIKNFWKEPKNKLLDAEDVALVTLKIIESWITWQNVDVRVDEFK